MISIRPLRLAVLAALAAVSVLPASAQEALEGSLWSRLTDSRTTLAVGLASNGPALRLATRADLVDLGRVRLGFEMGFLGARGPYNRSADALPDLGRDDLYLEQSASVVAGVAATRALTLRATAGLGGVVSLGDESLALSVRDLGLVVPVSAQAGLRLRPGLDLVLASTRSLPVGTSVGDALASADAAPPLEQWSLTAGLTLGL